MSIQGKGRVDPPLKRGREVVKDKSSSLNYSLPCERSELGIVITTISFSNPQRLYTCNTYITYINTMTLPTQPKQIKSHWYYVFWSIATIAVVIGQVYVATSYRYLAEALKLSLT